MWLAPSFRQQAGLDYLFGTRRQFGLNLNAHQLRERSNAQPFHDPGAVDLNSPHADPQILGNHFVHLTGCHTMKNLTLALGKGSDLIQELLPFGHVFALASVKSQCLVDAIQQILFPKWLANEIQGSPPHRLNRHLNITVSRNKNDG
jgi:hypothetical protein